MTGELFPVNTRSPCKESNCPLKGRTKVFGEGDESSPVVVVGQCPGNEEARIGRPFMGPAGRRLNRALIEMGLRRPDPFYSNTDQLPIKPPDPATLRMIWLTNTVKCFLPAKAAVPFEATLRCWPILLNELQRHITANRAIVIISVGSIAKNTIQQRIDHGELTGCDVHHRPVIHPAATLYRASNDIILTQQCARIRRELEGWGMVGKKCEMRSTLAGSSTTICFP